MSDTQAGTRLFVSRLLRLPLLDSTGAPLGRIADAVIAPAYATTAPRVVGFVASVQRRKIFVNANRIGELSASGARLRSGTIDVRVFDKRPGERLASGDVFDSRVGGDIVVDIGIVPRRGRMPGWEVDSVALGSSGLLRKRTRTVVGWQKAPGLFEGGSSVAAASALRAMHAADAATALAALPDDTAQQVALALDEDALAEIFEEMDEDDQARILENLDPERAARVLEEMEPDDAADLLAELPADEARDLLAAMEPEEADPVRRLLVYNPETAGGLMTPEPVVLPPDATVAEALARIRDPDVPSAHAAQVFVSELPTSTPTGRYLGTVGFQRLLREPPSITVGQCIEDGPEPLFADMAETDVAERLATYDLMAVPVVDSAGRLIGAVTIDDVLDQILPDEWRRT